MAPHHQIHASFAGRLVMLGFGSIGQGVLPLILRHIDLPKDRITIVTAESAGARSRPNTASNSSEAATRDNYRDLLTPLLRQGDFLLNLSVDVSSVGADALCQELDALYLDTVSSPGWAATPTRR